MLKNTLKSVVDSVGIVDVQCSNLGNLLLQEQLKKSQTGIRMKNRNKQNLSYFSGLIINSSLSSLLLALILLSFVFLQTVSASEQKPTGPDLHKFWDKNCSECHGHSADFSRKFLEIVDGKLQGPMHKDSFKTFLNNHYIRRNQQEAIYDMLLAENLIEPRYKNECSSCHKKAAEFVRESITLRDGKILISKEDTPVSEFLESHRGLTTEDIEFYMALLTRVASEVYRP